MCVDSAFFSAFFPFAIPLQKQNYPKLSKQNYPQDFFVFGGLWQMEKKLNQQTEMCILVLFHHTEMCILIIAQKCALVCCFSTKNTYFCVLIQKCTKIHMSV